MNYNDLRFSIFDLRLSKRTRLMNYNDLRFAIVKAYSLMNYNVGTQ